MYLVKSTLVLYYIIIKIKKEQFIKSSKKNNRLSVFLKSLKFKFFRVELSLLLIFKTKSIFFRSIL